MSTIDIRHAHSLPAENARKAIEEVAAKLSERFGLQSSWVGDVLNLSGSGAVSYTHLTLPTICSV